MPRRTLGADVPRRQRSQKRLCVRRDDPQPRSSLVPMRSLRPYLLVDIDGVLSPYGLDSCPDGFAVHLTPNMPEDGTLGEAWFCRSHGDWLIELSAQFDLVWASAWGYKANVVLAAI